MSISITVYGLPAPQGSKRHMGNGVLIESSKKVKPWRQDVKYAALLAVGEDWTLMDGPLIASMTFTFVRPRSHYRTGRNAHLLREGAPLRPAVPPDLSKILRSTEDALTGTVWHDDARVVGYDRLGKFYAGTDAPDVLRQGSGCVIRVWQLPPGDLCEHEIACIKNGNDWLHPFTVSVCDKPPKPRGAAAK